MPSRRKILTGAAIQKRLALGLGHGQGANYQPYLRVTDVPSRGTSSVITGWKHGRDHHLLSRLERNSFYCFEWRDDILEIREQYPLTPLERTLQIAKELGVKHPSVNGQPVLMTTDFFLILKALPMPIQAARSVKPLKELCKRRVQQKLEIERIYFEEQGIGWAIITEKDIPEVVWRNVDWLHECHDAWKLRPITVEQIDIVREYVRNELRVEKQVYLADFCLEADATLGLSTGVSLKVMRHLLANKIIQVNINVRLRTDVPITLHYS